MILFKTLIKESPGKGMGLFADEFIPKDSLVYENSTDSIHKDDTETLSTFSSFYMDTYTWNVGEYIYHTTDDTMYINHADNPSVDGVTGRALRDINPGEEITENYSTFDPEYDTYKHLLKP
jgi:SET domain-containing protein